MNKKTAAPCKGICNQREFDIPAGVSVRFAGMGYVVESEQETASIIGDSHTARHYFLWLSKDAELTNE